MIDNVVAEELSAGLNEGFWNTLGKVAKTAAIGAVAPTYLVQKGVQKANGVINGGETIFGHAKAGSTGGSRGSSSGKTRKQSRVDKQREKLSSARSIGYEYGRPETVPGFGRKFKLDKKTEIMVPEEVLDDKGKCIRWGSRTGDWGSFGRHYHDDGDRMWQRIFKDKENALLRNCRNDQSKLERLKKKYKKVLIDWLKERDKQYETYIKSTY